MNDQKKSSRAGMAGIASVLGGLAGALSRFRLIGREVRDLAQDLRHPGRETQESQAAKIGREAGPDQPRHRQPSETDDVIERKLQKTKPSQPSQVNLPPGWNLPRPHKLPSPTYWPAVLAGGVVVFAWGPPTSWVVSVVGGVVSIIAIKGWIGELRDESKSE